MRKTGLVEVIRGLRGSDVRFIEAFVVSTTPLKLQCTTDNALIIGDNNLLPVGEQFSAVTKNATIHQNDKSVRIQIEIDNSIKVDDLFLVLQFNENETCKFLLFDKI